MHLVSQPEKIQTLVRRWHSSGEKIGFVPTMGCLHEGHLSLIRAARKSCDRVVVSIFVNPLQFGKNEDFGSYPRPFERDSELCRSVGVDAIFHPHISEFYGPDFKTTVLSGALGQMYCGRSRPVFFDGVLTVVNILFNLVLPDRAYFGQKDYQQLYLIRQMVRNFRIPVEIVGMPIVREADGLAMSSRNEYLRKDQRDSALRLSRAIVLAQQAFRKGDVEGLSLMRKVETFLKEDPAFTFDYASLVDEKSLELVTGEVIRPTRLLLAGYLGDAPRVRLIDNGPIV